MTVSIVPYVKMELIANLGRTIFLFPFVGWLISVAAIILFAAEYVRCHDTEVEYHRLLGTSLSENHATQRFKALAPPFRSIGWTTISVLFVMSWLLSVGNASVLNMLLKPPNQPLGPGFYFVLGGLTVVYIILLAIYGRYVWLHRRDTA